MYHIILRIYRFIYLYVIYTYNILYILKVNKDIQMITMEQLRRHRFLNLTLIDLVPTIIVGLIIHSYMWLYPLELSSEEQSKRTFIQYSASLAIIVITLLGLGIMIHRIVGVKSGLSSHIGLNGLPNKKIG
jgi:hypothetical protein